MKVGRTGFALKSLIVIFLGFMVNYLSGYLIAYSQYLTFYKIKGLELINDEFIKKPLVAFDVLVLGGNSSKEVFIEINRIYSEPMFHVIFLCFYGYFVFSYFSKSKSMEKKDASDYGSHGSSRWATKKEIKPLMNEDEGFILGELNGSTVVHPKGKDTKGNDKTKLNQNVATFGGAGTGKTAGYAIPNILNNADNVGESMIITDPKGELYNKTSGYLRLKGYDILCFNLLDMTRSLRYNPLDYVTNTEEALSLANMIISNTEGKNNSGDSMWKNAEMAYFAALMMYLKETMPKELQTVKSVLQLGTRIGADEETLDDMFSGLPDDSEALEMYNIFRLAQDKTRAGILIGFGVRLKLWVSKNVANLTAASDFNLNQLGERKTALYLLIPDSNSTFDLIPALMIDQAFNELYKQAGRNDTERLTVDVRCFLDELANIAAINDFERKVSTMRSRGISVVPIFQSVTQFKNRYDQDRWSEILASSDTIVFLGTQDKLTAKYFSEKLGNTTLLINSLSESSNDRGNSESKSHNVIGRTLMTPDELERMGEDKVIIFQRGRYPMLLDKHFYFKQSQWANIPKVNWYSEIEPRRDPKLHVINPLAMKVVAAGEEIDVEEQAPEDSGGYISELLNDEKPVETVLDSHIQTSTIVTASINPELDNIEHPNPIETNKPVISNQDYEETEPSFSDGFDIETSEIQYEEIDINVEPNTEEDSPYDDNDYLSSLMEEDEYKH
ncbi:VirD4-like conjugal transfer protein, CD1115 family [Cytobacillus sp. FJAT-54145]|uniref:VirD4-like conjugal transfer protein, CD1115 family n=1 Tax=Cytobacillus spartinae TaxID=3299023 RepID=A0ABW6KM82_9BACI